MAFRFKLATALALSGTSLASWSQPRGDWPAAAHDGCSFSISSVGSFACPAGQLPDGQIRLNGTEDIATFSLGKDGGGFIDAKGFGCIVTAAPTTQIQCDQGASADTGFTIDGSNALLYHGSASFFACPATDTEYNIYVNPNFGQTKCFPITLQASGCGVTSPPPASTVWQTQTVTQVITQTITSITTIASTCPSSVTIGTSFVSNGNGTSVCHKCTKTGGTYASGLP